MLLSTLLPLLVSPIAPSSTTTLLQMSIWWCHIPMACRIVRHGWNLILGVAGLAIGLSPLLCVFPPSLLLAPFSASSPFSATIETVSDMSDCEQAARLAESQALLLHEARGAVSDSGLLVSAIFLMLQPSTVGKAAAGAAMAAAALPTRTPLPPFPPPPPPPAPPPAPPAPPHSSFRGKSSVDGSQQKNTKSERCENGRSMLALPGDVAVEGEIVGGAGGSAGGGPVEKVEKDSRALKSSSFLSIFV